MLLWPYDTILIFYRVLVVVMLLSPSNTIITGCDTFTTLFDPTLRLIDDDATVIATTDHYSCSSDNCPSAAINYEFLLQQVHLSWNYTDACCCSYSSIQEICWRRWRDWLQWPSYLDRDCFLNNDGIFLCFCSLYRYIRRYHISISTDTDPSRLHDSFSACFRSNDGSFDAATDTYCDGCYCCYWSSYHDDCCFH